MIYHFTIDDQNTSSGDEVLPINSYMIGEVIQETLELLEDLGTGGSGHAYNSKRGYSVRNGGFSFDLSSIDLNDNHYLHPHNLDPFVIEDPVNVMNNVAKNAFNCAQLQKVAQEALEKLRKLSVRRVAISKSRRLHSSNVSPHSKQETTTSLPPSVPPVPPVPSTSTESSTLSSSSASASTTADAIIHPESPTHNNNNKIKNNSNRRSISNKLMEYEKALHSSQAKTYTNSCIPSSVIGDNSNMAYDTSDTNDSVSLFPYDILKNVFDISMQYDCNGRINM